MAGKRADWKAVALVEPKDTKMAVLSAGMTFAWLVHWMVAKLAAPMVVYEAAMLVGKLAALKA